VGVLGPAAFRGSYGSAPPGALGAAGRSTARPAVQRFRRAGSLQPSFGPLACGRGLGLRPWRTSERLPPSFGLRKGRPTRRSEALQPVPREAAPPFAPPVSPTGRAAGAPCACSPAPTSLAMTQQTEIVHQAAATSTCRLTSWRSRRAAHAHDKADIETLPSQHHSCWPVRAGCRASGAGPGGA
jgi:hypothetical protein